MKGEIKYSMEELYLQIDDLIQALLIPARVEKKIDKTTLEKFYSILQELEKKMKDQEMIPRKIAGILFFIYTSLVDEAQYCRYDDELFIATARIGDIIDRILWDSPFKQYE